VAVSGHKSFAVRDVAFLAARAQPGGVIANIMVMVFRNAEFPTVSSPESHRLANAAWQSTLGASATGV
jgi:hypothetical protein